MGSRPIGLVYYYQLKKKRQTDRGMDPANPSEVETNGPNTCSVQEQINTCSVKAFYENLQLLGSGLTMCIKLTDT